MVAKKSATNVVPFDDESEGWEEVSSEFGKIVDPSQGPVIGTYIGFRVVELDDDKSKEPDAKRNQIAHDLASKDGEKVSVWGSYDLDHKLLNFDEVGPTSAKYEGSLIRIDFDEETPLKGGKTLKRYRVRVKA